MIMFSALVKAQDRLQLSGFTRLVGGTLATDKASYQEYEDHLSFSSFSLAAVQAEYQFSDTVKGSVQALYHASDDRQSGIEWLYLSYEPAESLQLKAGRLRTPVLFYSDVQDVGYAYPWVLAPQQLYSAYIFSRYEGASLRYRFAWQNTQFELEGYWGHFDDSIATGNLSRKVHVENLNGFIASAGFDNGLTLRLATLNVPEIEAGTSELNLLQNSLMQAGLNELADQITVDGGASLFIGSVGYEELDWFATAEWMGLDSDINLLVRLESYYLMIGRHLGDFQVFITLADSSFELNEIENTVPLGVAPKLDQLYYGIERLKGVLPTDELMTISVGARWDFRHGMAFKAELSRLDGEPGQTSFYDVGSIQKDFDGDTVLFQVAWEWVY